MTENISSEASVGGNENVLSPNGGNGTVSEGMGNNSSAPLHEVLNEVLGTTFTSPENAVKGLKDTQNYVGKAGKYAKAVEAVVAAKGFSEDDAVKFIMDSVQQAVAPAVVEAPVAQAVDTSKLVSREEFEKTMFYKDNPELAQYQDVLSPLAQSLNKPLSEVVEMDSVKSLIEAKKAQTESEKSKSVLISSPKLGAITDKMTQAREAVKSGDVSAARSAATAAVMEAYDIK